jgi:hypothetical protein
VPQGPGISATPGASGFLAIQNHELTAGDKMRQSDPNRKNH